MSFGDDPRIPRTSGKAIASLVLGLVSIVFTCFTGMPAALIGWRALREIKYSQGRLTGGVLAVIGIFLGLGASLLLLLVVGLVVGFGVREVRSHAIAEHNLKSIALAAHNYHDTFKMFPLTGVEFGPPGNEKPQQVTRRQLSWRVRLLPFLGVEGGMQLYEDFDFDETWDSPHNKALISRMPAIYETPGRSADSGKTRIQAIVFPRDPAAFKEVDPEIMRVYGNCVVFDRIYPKPSGDGVVRPQGAFAARIAYLFDGTSNTVMFVEADEPVIWTKPDDWELHLEEPHRGLGNLRTGGFFVTLADGSVRFLPNAIDDQSLRTLLVAQDGVQLDRRFD